MNRPTIALALLATALLQAPFGFAEQVPAGGGKPEAMTVQIRSVGFAKVASNHATSISAQCPGRSYSLRIAREQHSVMLVREDTGTSSDISATPFGATFLSKDLYGRFSFNCPSAVGINFFGFEAQKDGAPKAVEYILIIAENGAVLSDSGLRYESYQTVNHHLAQ